ncbi:MAG: MarC family protein [Opitutaceae bacterium]
MLNLALLLFLVMDPFGNLIILNSLLAPVPPAKRRMIIMREALFATIILMMAVFIGGPLLQMLDLEEYSIRLAGGIVLFLIALGMLFPSKKIIEEPGTEAPLIVPIAMPLIAGPSAISMVILFSEKHPHLTVAIAVLIASAASAAVLAVSAGLFSFLGRRGAVALERLMGMLLIMLSVEMLLDGIDTYLLSRVLS